MVSCLRFGSNRGSFDLSLDALICELTGPQGVFRAIEKLKQGGQEFVSIQMTSAGMVSSTDTVVPPGLPSGFFLIREAMSEHNKRTEEKRMFGEASYKALLDSIDSDKAEWDRFFSQPANKERTGEVIILLYTLFQVYQGRNSTEEWGHALDVLDNVMEHMDKVLKMSRAEKEYFRAQENFWHSANSSRLNLNMTTGNHADSPRLLKALCRHELEHVGHKDVYWMLADQIIDDLLKNKKALGYTDIGSNVLEISDEILFEGFNFLEKMKRNLGPDTVREAQSNAKDYMNSILPPEMRMKREEKQNNFKLLHCSNCAKQESACGEYKCCTRCKKVKFKVICIFPRRTLTLHLIRLSTAAELAKKLTGRRIRKVASRSSRKRYWLVMYVYQFSCLH